MAYKVLLPIIPSTLLLLERRIAEHYRKIKNSAFKSKRLVKAILAVFKFWPMAAILSDVLHFINFYRYLSSTYKNAPPPR